MVSYMPPPSTLLLLLALFGFDLAFVFCVQSGSQNQSGRATLSRTDSHVRNLAWQGVCAKCRAPNVAQFNFCWHRDTPPYRGLPFPCDRRAQPVRTDAVKLQARRDEVLAGIAVSPGQQRKCKMADDLDAFIRAHSEGFRGWDLATDEDVLDWCCFLDSHGNSTTWVHHASCPNVGSRPTANCPTSVNCAKQYAADSLDKGKASKLKMTYREQLGRGGEWDPVGKSWNPCSSRRVGSYLSYVSIEQKRVSVPVNQALHMLAHVLAEMSESMRSRTQLEQSLAQRITITRDIALVSLVFASMRRGYDLSFTKGSQVLRLAKSRGLIFDFPFGKVLRKYIRIGYLESSSTSKVRLLGMSSTQPT